MPGRVPLNNAKFINSADFNYQAVSGITGSGVFRQFSYNNTGTNVVEISNLDLWRMVQLTGNCIVTVPAGISANVGDEILIINTTGTISFTTSGGANILGIIGLTLYAIPAERPARLIYAGSDNWILAGARTNYNANSANTCCGAELSPVYTFNSWPEGPAYSDPYGTSLYTYSALGGIAVLGGTGYTISSGIISESPCATVDFTTPYTFYDNVGLPYTFYSYLSVNIFSPEILGVPFKITSTSGVYPCDSAAAVGNGTWYRTSGVYGVSNPVCFNNGVVTHTTACP